MLLHLYCRGECCSRAPTAQSFTMRTYLDWQNEGVRRVDDLRIEHIIHELARLLLWMTQMKAPEGYEHDWWGVETSSYLDWRGTITALA